MIKVTFFKTNYNNSTICINKICTPNKTSGNSKLFYEIKGNFCCDRYENLSPLNNRIDFNIVNCLQYVLFHDEYLKVQTITSSVSCCIGIIQVLHRRNNRQMCYANQFSELTQLQIKAVGFILERPIVQKRPPWTKAYQLSVWTNLHHIRL